MGSENAPGELYPLETRAVKVGFFLVGIVFFLTAVGAGLYMKIPKQWLVWVVAAVFAAFGFLAFDWSRGYPSLQGDTPKEKKRLFLILAIPFAYILGSQLCGFGVSGFALICNTFHVLMMMLAVLIAVRIYRDQPIGFPLILLIILSVLPHCVCNLQINILWHKIFSGFAPTCGAAQLTVALFSISALRGIRPSKSMAIAGVLFSVIILVAVATLIFGVPWIGCAL